MVSVLANISQGQLIIEQFLTISQLNDFLFCPYSIYLHNVYKGAEEAVYHAVPQTKGKNAHQNIDQQKYSSSKQVLSGLDVYSEELGLIGKIDIYYGDTQKLSERKRQIKHIYPGYVFQLHAQYFCMLEMGYKIKQLEFHSLVDNRTYAQDLPTANDKTALLDFIKQIKAYYPGDPIDINPTKCRHCIYSNLCDYTSHGHVHE